MKSIKNQNGVATVLMVILIGISIMTVTVVMARSYITKKESNVSSHAQVNSQLMSWAGVNAFREYILKTGESDFEAIKALQNTDVILKNVQGHKNVRANNIKVTGCATETDECIVEAEISAVNLSSKSATTLQIVFDVTLKNLGVTIPKMGASTFGGGLILDGTIGAEEPNSKITLNVDGDLTVNTGARFQNIDELNINTCGDVTIYCSLVSSSSFCKIPKINITACGDITITDLAQLGNFGELYAGGAVSLQGAQTGNVYSLKPASNAAISLETLGIGDVNIISGARTGDVYSAGTVIVHTASSASNIYADGRVKVTGINAKAKNITANKNVELWLGGSAENIYSGGEVAVHTGSQSWNIEANGKVYVGGLGARTQDIRSNGQVDLWAGAKADSVYTKRYVYISASEIYGEVVAKGESTTTQGATVYGLAWPTLYGNVYVQGSVRIIHTVWELCDRMKGNVYASSFIREGGLLSNECGGRFKANNASNITAKINALETMPTHPLDTDTMKQEIIDVIDERTGGIKSYVSVYPYKEEANYIFTKGYGTKRVFLNKLTNAANDEYYFYDVVDGKQYVEKDGSQELLNGTGEAFYLGKYKLGGQTYIGAVCAEGDSDGFCTSNIIGYLPRIGLKENPSVDGGLFTGIGVGIINLFTGSKNADYEYLNGNRYVVSSVSKRSNIDNAVLAPGIMYFDDDLVIRGRGVSASTGSDYSAFINTFLAEGDIDVALFSPNIYSPYNATRETTESAVCDRVLKNMDNMVQGIPATEPETESNKYLRATNLCKSGNKFSNSMNIDSATNTILSINIDGKMVPKLDLGYVGLMSNKSIHLQFCSQIYGDVLAKGAIHSSTELICGGGQRQKVTGSMTSETGNTGLGGLLGALANTNKIMLGASYIVAKQEYSNFDGGQEVPEPQDQLATESVTVKWARSK